LDEVKQKNVGEIFLMKYVLITGSCGLVGAEAVKFFDKKNFKIIGIDNNYRKTFFGPSASVEWSKKFLKSNIKNYQHYDVDITNYKELEKIFKKYKNKIKCIINCAAQPSHDWAVKNITLDFNINTIGTLNLLEQFKKYSSKSCFVQISTNKVYGDTPNKLSLIEKKTRFELQAKSKYYKGIDATMTIDNSIHSFFGVSKCGADLLTQEYGKNLGLKTVVFRLGCITGPGHSGAVLHGFLSYLVKCNIQNKKYEIFGYKGKQVRDNIHSYDLVNAIWQYLKKPKKGKVYNLGGGRANSCSVLEAIKKVESLSKKNFRYKILKKNRTGDHKWYITDNSKFKNDYKNWQIKYDLESIIQEIIEGESKKLNI
jgi:CDP-paratose 2-epimerase